MTETSKDLSGSLEKKEAHHVEKEGSFGGTKAKASSNAVFEQARTGEGIYNQSKSERLYGRNMLSAQNSLTPRSFQS